ncbi:hypothetical protein V8G61_12885 [Gaetbulibacter sp. M240]|uniref:hypothetical protein n=1 Tax=Gaetbulibacter sp. M240 TaxID=3126511 RepID=UPI00374E3802
MNKLPNLFYIALASVMFMSANAQELSSIYDYTEVNLNSVDTVPDYASKAEKIKITGTIYKNDGVTPAEGVILYVYQTNEKGNFKMKRDDQGKRYVKHSAWVKTDKDGKYTIYTFMPGKYYHTKELKQIQRVVKEPGKKEYALNPFFFDDDPLIADLTLSCRSKVAQSMLRLNEKDGMLVAEEDIRLNSNTTVTTIALGQ